MLRSRLPILGASILLIAASGCVPYQTHSDLKNEYTRAEKINRDLTTKLNQLVSEYNRLRGGEEFGDATIENLRQRLANMSQANAELARTVEELRQYQDRLPKVGFVEEDIPAGSGITLDPDTRALVLEEGILFNSGEAVLKNRTAMKALDELASLLRTKYSGETFHLIGHTDNTALVKTKKLWKTNKRLSFARAYTVFEYLLTQGISENQMIIHAYGSNKPTDPLTANTKAGRARNRRVEIYRAGASL